MANWQKILAQSVVNVEEQFDLLKYRLRERRGPRSPVMITPYRGYGKPEKLYIRGRVLEDKGIPEPEDNDTLWDNLVNMYKRFETDEIPYAEVMVRFQHLSKIVRTDVEGHFEVEIEATAPLQEDQLWQEVHMELVKPQRKGSETVQCKGNVLVPPPSSRYGVISDIDDTVLKTNATNLVRMARTVFLGNAHTRLPFKGVAAFYRALFKGQSGNEQNPLFYVSSSPWNLYDLLSDFFNLQDIPIGPVLFLRDWGINEVEILPVKHRDYKTRTIRRILDFYDTMPFILIGDSGQEDPEIYHEIVSAYPERILAVYIRNVSKGLKRAEAINALAEQVVKAGSTLILAENTLPMAEHAAQEGWISASMLPEIEERVEIDEAPPGIIEQLLGDDLVEEPEPPTVVIDEGSQEATEQAVEDGAVEEAVEETGDESSKPPTVVVKGDE